MVSPGCYHKMNVLCKKELKYIAKKVCKTLLRSVMEMIEKCKLQIERLYPCFKLLLVVRSRLFFNKNIDIKFSAQSVSGITSCFQIIWYKHNNKVCRTNFTEFIITYHWLCDARQILKPSLKSDLIFRNQY